MHSVTDLKHRRKKGEGEKHAGERGRFCGAPLPPSVSLAPSLFLARLLTSPQAKRRILVSPVKPSVKRCTFFLFFYSPLPLSLSLFLFLSHSRRWQSCCEGRFYTLFKQEQFNTPPPHFLCQGLHMPAHPLEILELTTNAKALTAEREKESPSTELCN